ncbi:hypothetical protein [Nonomuraea sp. NPDC003754]
MIQDKRPGTRVLGVAAAPGRAIAANTANTAGPRAVAREVGR